MSRASRRLFRICAIVALLLLCVTAVAYWVSGVRRARQGPILRFQPTSPPAELRLLDVRIAVKGGVVQTGRVKASQTRDDDGSTNEIDMQIELGPGGQLVLQLWPPPQDAGFSILFAPPGDPLGAAEWPAGSLTLTTDEGDKNAGAVMISKQ